MLLANEIRFEIRVLYFVKQVGLISMIYSNEEI